MTDVVIVGAGAVGLFCAARLARRGARVTVLEAEREDFSSHGPASSLAAAGMLAPLSEAFLDGPTHPRLAELGLASFDLWRRLHEDALWADGVRFDGAVSLAPDAGEAARMTAQARALGRGLAPISAAQARRRLGVEPRADHMFEIADEAVADPGRVLSGLAMETRRYGGQIVFGCDVESVTAAAATSFEGERFEADAVLLAPGAWASDTLAAAAPALKRLRPAKGHIAPVRLAHTLGATLHAPGFYLARRGEDDVALGSTMEFDTFSRAVDPVRVAALMAAAEKTLPGAVRAHEEARPWAGVRPMSPDWAPLIGRDESGVLVACGHSRNGWLLAPITAEIICAHVFGDAIEPLWAAFAPDRFAG